MYKGRNNDDLYEFDDVEENSSEDIYRRRVAEQRSRDNRNSSRRNTIARNSRNAKKRKRINWIRIFVNFVAIALICFSVFMIWWRVGIRDERIDPQSDIESKEFKPIQSSTSDDVRYILVCGFDEENIRTDVNMLVCWNLKEKTASVLQIPRDTYMGDGYYHSNYDKFNAVYQNPQEGESAAKAVCRKINSAFGLPVDYYVMFSIEAFRNVVDTLGGVEVDVEQTMSYDGVTLYPGTQVLDGRQAEIFMRVRKIYNEGDTGRMKAQRKFYAGLMEKATNMSIPQLIAVLDEVKDELVTNMTYGELRDFVSQAKDLDMKNVNFFGLPGESYDFYRDPSTKSGWISFFTVHKDEYVELANKYFNPLGNTIYAEDIEIKQMSYYGESLFQEDESNSNLNDYKESTADEEETTETTAYVYQ